MCSEQESALHKEYYWKGCCSPSKDTNLFQFSKHIVIRLTYLWYGDISAATMGYTWKKTMEASGLSKPVCCVGVLMYI